MLRMRRWHRRARWRSIAAAICRVWSHTQGPYPLRSALANVLGVPQDTITVRHAHGAGCYGHNGADDVAVDAAVIAMQLPDHCIRVQWRREEEFGFEPVGSAMHVTLHAALDAAGNRWIRLRKYGRPRTSSDPAAAATCWTQRGVADTAAGSSAHRSPPEASGGGGTRNAFPLYDFAAKRALGIIWCCICRKWTSARVGWARCRTCLRLSASWTNWRSAPASIPVEYRLSVLSDPRARRLIERLAANCNWAAFRRAVGAGLAWVSAEVIEQAFCCCAWRGRRAGDQSGWRFEGGSRIVGWRMDPAFRRGDRETEIIDALDQADVGIAYAMRCGSRATRARIRICCRSGLQRC